LKELANTIKEPLKNYSFMTFVLCWSGLVIMSSLYITIPLISTFTDIFKVTPTQAAWTSSSFSFCFAIGCLFYGPLSDRFGRKTVILLGLSILAVISLLMGLITDLSWLILFRALNNYLSSPVFGFTAQQILYVRSMGIIGMLLSPYAGQLVEKHGLFSVLRTGMVLSIFGLLLLGISTSLVSIVVSSILFIAGLAIFAPTVIAIIGRLGGSARGAAVSAYTFILFAGASIGPIFALNILKTGGYFLTFLALALCLCFGLLASFFIRMDDEIKES